MSGQEGWPIMLRSWPRAIVHLDGDAFFASCEQAVHPEYRGRPVVTGKERGIVAAASYEAKARGISRGVPLWEVKKLCPDAIIVPSDYETYSLFSKRLFAIMRRFTSLVEEYSIDEGFADITGLQRPFHASYGTIAQRMKEAVESELGITVSVGVSLSKVLAKIASKHKKPSGLTLIPGPKIHEFLARTTLEKVWGIGPSTTSYCRQLNISTALAFARQREDFIKKYFTKPHYEIWQELNGHPVYEVTAEEKTDYAAISKTKTFTPPSGDYEYVFAQLLKNLENACIKARRHHLVARGLIIYLRRQDYKDQATEIKLSRASAFPPDMVALVRQVYSALYQTHTPYRATGVILTALIPEAGIQQSLFEPVVKIERLQKIYAALDSLAEKFGKHTVHLAASTAANTVPQHLKDRGDITARKQNRIKGEGCRKHLAIPLLMNNEK